MMTKEEFAKEMRDRIHEEMGDGYEEKSSTSPRTTAWN